MAIELALAAVDGAVVSVFDVVSCQFRANSLARQASHPLLHRCLWEFGWVLGLVPRHVLGQELHVGGLVFAANKSVAKMVHGMETRTRAAGSGTVG